MIRTGKDLLVSSAISWQQIWDNLLEYASALNDVDRDSLKKGSVKRIDLQPDAVMRIKGFAHQDPGLTTLGWRIIGSNFVESASGTKRLVFDIDEPRSRSILVAWRVSGTAMTGNPGLACSMIRGQLSVDDVIIPAFKSDVLRQFSYSMDGGPIASDRMSIGGAGVVNVNAGRHTISIMFQSEIHYMVKSIEVSATSLGM